jgi:hypothetical protein
MGVFRVGRSTVISPRLITDPPLIATSIRAVSAITGEDEELDGDIVGDLRPCVRDVLAGGQATH